MSGCTQFGGGGAKRTGACVVGGSDNQYLGLQGSCMSPNKQLFIQTCEAN